MESKIFKDILKYKKTIIGLTYRQVLSIISIILFSILIIYLCQNVLYIYNNTTITIFCVIIGIPIGFYGFFEYDGETAEIVFKNLLKYIKRIKFLYH